MRRVPVRLLAIAVFLISFGLLLPGVASHITAGDSGELALAGETLGIPHSPGYPVFALVHNAGARLLFFGNAAYQQNVIACLLIALTLALLGVLCALVTGRRETAFLPLLLLAAPQFRHLAWVTEVFPLAVFWAVLVYLALMRWHRRRNGVYLVAFLMGIGVAVHQTLVLLVPSLLVYLSWNRSKAFGTLWRDALPIAAFFLLGLSVHLYLPFRSFAEPLLDWEDPETFARFWGVLTRERYGFFQLAQGQGGPDLSWTAFRNAVRHTHDMFVLNIGWIGLGLVLLGSLASLARRVHRRWMVVTWLHVILTGPVFFWMARADPRTAGGLLERFSALPLVGAILLVALATATLLASGLRLYRGFLAAVLVVFVLERAFAHPFPGDPGPSASWALAAAGERADSASAEPVERSLRWAASIRESGLNALRMAPRGALLFADRADETEFSLAFLLFAEARRPDVLFIDCNAGVTRSVYGDDYYRIWGRPRLARRESVEREMVRAHDAPVVYATLDPTMIDIYRTHRGLLYRAWPLNRVQDPSAFPWAAITSWRFYPSEIRSRALARTNLDLLGRSSFERGHGDWAERSFGLAQLAGGAHRFETLGFWHQTRGAISEARRWYQRAMGAGVASEALYTNQGALEMEVGRPAEARALYEQGLRRYPDSQGLLYNLALVHWRTGRRSEAEPLLRRVLERDPKNAEAHRLLQELNNRGF